MRAGRLRRSASALVAAALLAIACADDDVADGAAEPGAPAVTEPGSAPPPDPGDGAPTGEQPSTPAPAPAPGDPGPGGTAAPQPSEAPPPSPEEPPPAPTGVGGYAPFFLRPSESASLVVEVRSQEGAGPRSATLDHLRTTVAGVAPKPVDLVTGSVPGGARDWTAADLRALADQGPVQSRSAARLRLLFLRGTYEGDDGVLGIAVRSDVAAVFSDRVEAAAGPLAAAGPIEAAVAVHEVGHLLGLVDLFLDTGRQDPEHPGHSPNRDSVMYYAVESSLVGQLLGGPPPRDFDQADRADLATIAQG